MSSPHELGIHGTVDMYRRGECRCEPCTAAFMRSVPHGTLSGARHHGCTCDLCIAARRTYGRAHAWVQREGRTVETLPPPKGRPNWSVEQIRAALHAYYEAHGELPDRKSGEGLPSGRTWYGAMKWLRTQGYTLGELLGRPQRRHVDPDFRWSLRAVADAAHDFAARNGRWPTSKDGAEEMLGGRTWGTAAGWLAQHGLTLTALSTAATAATGEREHAAGPTYETHASA